MACRYARSARAASAGPAAETISNDRHVDSMAAHMQLHARRCRSRGSDHLRLRQQPPRPGPRAQASTDAFDVGGFVPMFIRPLFCEGKGPFRWAVLSGDPAGPCGNRRGDSRRRFPEDRGAGALDPSWPSERVAFQGLPARICWLGYGERAQRRAGCSTTWSPPVKVSAPIVIGRDHLDCGSVRLTQS